jgi:hypothetical protein
MAQFNGWDIQVYTDPRVIDAQGISITGNDFMVNASSGTAFEITHCVNGTGSGCAPTDGPGMVHSAYGNTGILTGNGLLFTITYKVITPSPYSYILFGNDQVSSPSSGSGVSHVDFTGAYGTLPATWIGGKRPLVT